jgi:hypothetical protein
MGAAASLTRKAITSAIAPGAAACAARDMLGGNGVLLENHIIRHMGDIEVIHTYEGTETMQTSIVGRDMTGMTPSPEEQSGCAAGQPSATTARATKPSRVCS